MIKEGRKVLNFFIGIVIILILAVLGIFYDFQILLFFESLRNVFLTELLAILFFNSAIIIFYLFTIILLWKTNKKNYILPLLIGLGLSLFLGYLTKNFIARPRPFLIYPELIDLNIASFYSSLGHFSFPSSHAISVFFCLPILNKALPKLKYFWISFAIVVALSRVYFGVHYFTDVLAGAVLGYAIGFIFLKIAEKYSSNKKNIVKKKR
ncbi:MAG: phosphatase PAP2 family protein [Nanoarchaeota archaeon]|nr:phosphatase PAP2 family protein [Nanoarchaeota archaeon]